MSEYSTVLKRIYELLATFIKDSELNESSELVAQYGMNSLQVMELIADIEDDFDISVPLNTVSDILTVGDLAREIQALVD
ncbi:MAG: acyl carrier protein [Gammaproteobacteria bacterium]|nr:MAG: acyl carrier protein [Gammaproteobacteria bacterium]RLA53957.1 MAG: acyl carrier protein [Gammaproteobacteria bacterium]